MKPFRISPLDLISLLIIAAVGALHLPYPYMGDQALFNMAAIEMHAGEVLYRDFWDLKLPGIFVFFYTGGRIFGFDEVGVHALELLWHLVLCALLLVTLAPHFRTRAGRALVPLLTIGLYYASAGIWHLTQTEILTALPIYCVMWLTQIAARSDGRARAIALFASGVAGGIVAVTKLIFMPIVGVFWLSCLAQIFARGSSSPGRQRDRNHAVRSAAEIVLLPMLGMAVPIGAVVIYFGSRDLLDTLWWTAIVYPGKIAATVPAHSLDRLIDSLRWYLGWFAPMCSLAVLGVWVSWRHERGLFAINLVMWIVSSIGVILIQRQAWSWQYHYLLLIVPTGILGAIAIEEIALRLTSQSSDTEPPQSAGDGISFRAGLFTALAVGMLASPFVLNLAGKAKALAGSGFGRTPEARLQFQQKMNGDYTTALRETAFLGESDAAPGDIFVWGNPLLYHVSGRGQATAINGWLTIFTIDEQWPVLVEQLREARPEYIFVEREYDRYIGAVGAPFLEFIESHYTPHASSDVGDWFALAPDSPGSAAPLN